MTEARNSLQPLTDTVRLLWAGTTVVSVVVVLLVAFFSFGAPACFTSELGTGLLGHASRQDVGHISAQSLNICLSDPGAGDRVLHVLDMALPLAGYAVVFFLLMRLLERAAREGVHTTATARGIRRLGWFVLVLVPAVTAGEAAARIGLLRRVMPEAADFTRLTAAWDVPWWAFVTGLGLLALAKIMRTSAEMRADLEGTV